MAELYKQVVCDTFGDNKKNFDENRKQLVTEISDQNNMLTKIRDQVKKLWTRSYIFSFGGLDFLLYAGRIPHLNKLTTSRFHS